MNEELKETVLKVAEYSNSEKEVKRKKLNKCFRNSRHYLQ